MTNEEKLKVNTIADTLLGKGRRVVETYKIGIKGPLYVRDDPRTDIFTNADDCLEVVKVLSKIHWSNIMYNVDMQCWCADDPNTWDDTLTGFESYEEAVAAAVMEAMK